MNPVRFIRSKKSIDKLSKNIATKLYRKIGSIFKDTEPRAGNR